MGVYVKRLKMPINCEFCPFSAPGFDLGIVCDITKKYSDNPWGGRLETCPIVYERPDHDLEVAAYRMAVKSLEAKLKDARRRANRAELLLRGR